MTKRKQNIKVSILLNFSFTILELIGGLLTNSLAILSDALHDFGDTVALTTSWILEVKAKQPPDKRRTFGYQRFSLLSAVFSGAVLLGGSLFILSKAIPRLINPEHVNARGMMLFAIVGILFNGAGFFRLKKGESLNEKVLSWHFLEDVVGWGVILIGSIIIQFRDIHLIDPIMTLGFTIFIFFGVAKNLREAFNIFLQGVPEHIDIDTVKRTLSSIKGVIGVHDVHIWSLEGETDIFTGHIVVEDELLNNPDNIKKIIKEKLIKNHIEHSTIELESKDYCSGNECVT